MHPNLSTLLLLFLCGSRLLGLEHPVILPDYHADPSARLFGGRIYVYPSRDIAGSKGWRMLDWPLYSSEDLVHWTDHGVLLSVRDLRWGEPRKAYAPDCIEYQGRYYFYFPANAQIGVAVGEHPTGPFKDTLGKPLIAREDTPIYAIDPHVFVESDGQAYLFFGGNSRLGLARLKRNMIEIEGPLEELHLPEFHEGLWVHKYKNTYYFTYPSMRGDRIANLLEYSTAPSLLGPYTHRGVLLDNRSRNVHGSTLEFKGRWYLFYHVEGPSAFERKTCLLPFEHRDDGSIQPLTPAHEVHFKTP